MKLMCQNKKIRVRLLKRSILSLFWTVSNQKSSLVIHFEKKIGKFQSRTDKKDDYRDTLKNLIKLENIKCFGPSEVDN